MASQKTYSFTDVAVAMAHPTAGDFATAGQVGLNQLTVVMTQERTVHDVAADGTVMISYIAGDNGEFHVEIQQTSRIHTYLLNWYNVCVIAANAGDVSNWAMMTMTIRSLQDTSEHFMNGGAPTKIPDKVYAAPGGRITWNIKGGFVQSITLV